MIRSTASAKARKSICPSGVNGGTVVLKMPFMARDLEVKYEEIDSGALSAAAVLSGAAQLTSDDLMGIAPLAKQGKEFLMVYNLLDRMTMDLIVRKEVIERSGVDLKSDVKSRAK